MKGIDKLAKVVTKVLEVTHWVAEALMLAAAILSIIGPFLLSTCIHWKYRPFCPPD